MGEAMTEPCVTTRHAIDLPGGRLDYQARAGTVRVGRDDGSPLADVFYLAYLAESAATDPHRHLPELIAVRRRLTIRVAVRADHPGGRVMTRLRPLLDEGVALARRLADVAPPEQGREAQRRALTDRAMFLVAETQYGEAHDDFAAALVLGGR